MFSYLSVFYINCISWCVCIRGKAEQIISKLLLYFIFCRKILGSIAYCQLYSGTGTAIRFRRWTLAGPFLIWLNRFREYYLHCLTWFAGRDAPSRWSGWLKKKYQNIVWIWNTKIHFHKVCDLHKLQDFLTCF